jgi:putative Holliday junction resolvase
LRVLGIDYGEKRIGLAVTDPTGTIASPLETLRRRAGKRPPVARLAEIASELGVERLVVGLPLDLQGRETEWCAQVRAFGDALSARSGLPVAYVDERLTSVQAERAVRSLGLGKRERERKERIDAAAAALILQAWLDGRRS